MMLMLSDVADRESTVLSESGSRQVSEAGRAESQTSNNPQQPISKRLYTPKVETDPGQT